MSAAARAGVTPPAVSSDDPTLASHLLGLADADPDLVLLTGPDGGARRGEMAGRVRRLAAGLAGMGIHEGDRVAVFAGDRLEHVELLFALNLLGAAYCPINPEYHGDTLARILSILQPAAIVVDPKRGGVLRRLPLSVDCVITLDAAEAPPSTDRTCSYATLLEADEAAARTGGGGAATAMVLLTSGTSGRSKAVAMSNRFCIEVGVQNARARLVAPADRLHSCYPFCHTNVHCFTLIPALVAGASMAWSPRFSASGFWAQIRALGATQFSLFTATFLLLLSRPASEHDRSHGASTCFAIGTPQGRGQEFEERFGVAIVEGYGMTECGAVAYQWHGARRLGSVGKPTPGWQVQVIDDCDIPVGPGTVGEIAARPQRAGLLMDGYLGDPQATLELYRTLWLHTGDRGYTDDDGFLWFVDRKKDVIRRRGENIAAADVEAGVRRTQLATDCAAYAVPSELGEDDVMVAVTTASVAADLPGLYEALTAQLPRHALPRYLRRVDALPRTPTGRVQKHELQKEGVTPDTWAGGASAGRTERSL